jgi:hypothetical protein
LTIRINRTVPLPYARPAPTNLTAAQRIEAKSLQRQGLLFSDIARALAVPYELVVQALYWDAIR